MIELESFEEKISILNNEHIMLVSENKVINDQINNLETENKKLDKKVKISDRAVQFVDKIICNRRNKFKTKLENLVSEALKCVFGNSYSIEFEHSIKSNKSAVDIYYLKETKNGQVKRKINSFSGGVGGGVGDTIALPLKLLMLMSAKKVDKVLIADECGKHLDDENVEKFAQFINTVSKKMGIQILFSSHHQVMESYSDCVYVIENNDGETTSRKVK